MPPREGEGEGEGGRQCRRLSARATRNDRISAEYEFPRRTREIKAFERGSLRSLDSAVSRLKLSLVSLDSSRIAYRDPEVKVYSAVSRLEGSSNNQEGSFLRCHFAYSSEHLSWRSRRTAETKGNIMIFCRM